MMTFTRCGRNHLLFILLLIILMSGSVSPAGADTRYVSDQLIISVREGPTAEDPVVGYLLTGAPVEVLDLEIVDLFGCGDIIVSRTCLGPPHFHLVFQFIDSG
ncbi:MAG: hypothetical protein JRF32_12800, partial [Deltaproteobacteria bacterium]|nr:hypothetical protein [Deltaproteobacteria bacterium]